jgi:hypothetical protein
MDSNSARTFLQVVLGIALDFKNPPQSGMLILIAQWNRHCGAGCTVACLVVERPPSPTEIKSHPIAPESNWVLPLLHSSHHTSYTYHTEPGNVYRNVFSSRKTITPPTLLDNRSVAPRTFSEYPKIAIERSGSSTWHSTWYPSNPLLYGCSCTDTKHNYYRDAPEQHLPQPPYCFLRHGSAG